MCMFLFLLIYFRYYSVSNVKKIEKRSIINLYFFLILSEIIYTYHNNYCASCLFVTICFIHFLCNTNEFLQNFIFMNGERLRFVFAMRRNVSRERVAK